MKRQHIFVVFLSLLLALLACNLPQSQRSAISATSAGDQVLPAESSIATQPTTRSAATTVQPGLRIQPEALEYRGTFRLPEGSGGSNWEYSGQGLTYYPEGEPQGPDDGYPGSLFGVGHDHQLFVSEISIPRAVASKNLEDLNTATTLQPFNDLTEGIFTAEEMVLPVAGLEYLPPQGEQTSGKLHFAYGQHMQFFEPSHGWSELDLAHPQAAGPWHFGDVTNYASNDYLFEIPAGWANRYTPGQRLASGRFREGLWGGGGPALFAYGPWQDGDPPAPNAELTAVTPLLLYGEPDRENADIVNFDESMQMQTYQQADHWMGGSWLTTGERSAVIFVGTKALGESWYGFANGVVFEWGCDEQDPPTCPQVPEWPYDNRGFWAEDYQAQMIFFDTADLARVAQGEWESWRPQPYASMVLDEFLLDPHLQVEEYKRDFLGAVAFDRARGILYVLERLADEYKSVIHVFQISPEG